MNAASNHAREAGQALSVLSNGQRELKPAHAKVNLGGKLNVIVSEHLYQHFNKPVRARLALDLYPGKLVVELIPDDMKGRSISPFRSGERRVNWEPQKVENCGPSFPKFGMTTPDSVVIGRDGILRIVLPKNRRPLSASGPRRKMAATPVRKEPEVQKKESESKTASPAPARPSMVAGDRVITMSQKDTMVSHSKTGITVRVGRELAKYLEGHYYGATSFSATDDSKEIHITLKHAAANYRLGTTPLGPNKEHRALKISPIKNHSKVPLFGLTQANEVLVVDDGKTIVITLTGPFTPPGSKTFYKGNDKPVHSTRSRSAAKETPVATVKSDEDRLSKLRRLRDEINDCVTEAKTAGDEVTLRVKDDGKLGFTYEG